MLFSEILRSNIQRATRLWPQDSSLKGKWRRVLRKFLSQCWPARKGQQMLEVHETSVSPLLYLFYGKKEKTLPWNWKDNFKPVKLISMSFSSYRLVVKFKYKNKLLCKNILQMCEMLWKLNIIILKSFIKMKVYELHLIKVIIYLEKLHFQKERNKLKNTYSNPALPTLKVILERGELLEFIPKTWIIEYVHI